MRLLFTFLLFASFITVQAQNPIIVEIDSLFTVEFPNKPTTETSTTWTNGNSSYKQVISVINEGERFQVIKTAGRAVECASNRNELRKLYIRQNDIISDTIVNRQKVDTYGVSLQKNLYLSDLYYTANNRNYEIKMIQVQDTLYHFIYDFNSSKSRIGISNVFLSSLKVAPGWSERDQYLDCDLHTTQSNKDNGHLQRSYDAGFSFGQIIAPILCLGFGVAVIGGLVLIILNIQKKKRKKEQDEFDQYN